LHPSILRQDSKVTGTQRNTKWAKLLIFSYMSTLFSYNTIGNIVLIVLPDLPEKVGNLPIYLGMCCPLTYEGISLYCDITVVIRLLKTLELTGELKEEHKKWSSFGIFLSAASIISTVLLLFLIPGFAIFNWGLVAPALMTAASLHLTAITKLVSVAHLGIEAPDLWRTTMPSTMSQTLKSGAETLTIQHHYVAEVDSMGASPK